MTAVAQVQQKYPALRIEEAGDASAERALNKTLGNDFHRAELLSMPLTLGILLAVFGALVAAVVPLALAITAFIAAGGLLALTSRAVHVDGTATSVMLLIGLAVGVDYTLFYLKREREERAKGRSAADALAIAGATSGRSVLVSGCTVVAALAGLFLTGDGTFEGVAEATVLVVVDRRARVGDGAAGIDVGAWRPHREGAGAVRAPAAPAGRREPGVARVARPRAASAEGVGRRLRVACSLRWRCRCLR